MGQADSYIIGIGDQNQPFLVTYLYASGSDFEELLNIYMIDNLGINPFNPRRESPRLGYDVANHTTVVDVGMQVMDCKGCGVFYYGNGTAVPNDQAIQMPTVLNTAGQASAGGIVTPY